MCCENDCCKTTSCFAWVGFTVAFIIAIILSVITIPVAPEGTLEGMAAYTEVCGWGGLFCNPISPFIDVSSNQTDFKMTFQSTSALASRGLVFSASTDDYPIQSEFLGLGVIPTGSALLADDGDNDNIKPPPPPRAEVLTFTKAAHFEEAFDHANKYMPSLLMGVSRKAFVTAIPEMMRLVKAAGGIKFNNSESPEPATGKKLLQADPILVCPISSWSTLNLKPNDWRGPFKGMIVSRGTDAQKSHAVTQDTTFERGTGTRFTIGYPEVSGEIPLRIALWYLSCALRTLMWKYPLSKYDWGLVFGTSSASTEYILKKNEFPATYAWAFAARNMQIITGPDKGKHIPMNDNDKKRLEGHTWVANSLMWIILVVVFQIPWIVVTSLICCGCCKKKAEGVSPQVAPVGQEVKGGL